MGEGKVTGLFRGISRSRPEWVAQGVLKYALENRPKIRERFEQALGIAHDSLDPHFEVEEEKPTQWGWRADLVLAWDGRHYPIELKLRAGFTRSQTEAAGNMEAVVVPSGREKSAARFVVNEDTRRVLSWGCLATALSENDPLGELLREIDGFVFDWLEEISASDVKKQLLAVRAGGDWPRLYQWLCTLDREITTRNQRYEPNTGWSYSKGEPTYYGYYFECPVGEGPPGSSAY